ncbi:HTR-like protein [Halorubellus sp. JP-L1]|uniref:RAD55 family ATPase n=1 Tax=Halorubellus sp. JP-L1 TaxID=2715753 RepID=UPI0014083D73|nr:HTR-like protein [Halorubellus sp. JP-L1]NHN41308.1 HTR-like protein [Halorubellus sp. JP-L1]
MDRLPFGISRLDSMIDGGAPPGSVVLLAGEVGAGAREFVYTAVAMNGLAHADAELFDLYYGGLHGDAVVPDDIHYISFTEERDAIVSEMQYAMDDDIVDAGADAVSFADFSTEYFDLSQVPREWYTGKTRKITELGDRNERRGTLDAVGEYMNDHASGSLVVVDSVTDLLSAASGDMTWNEITLLMKGLKKASYEWGGLVLLLVNTEALSSQQLGGLMESTDGSLLFEWESGGSERARTLVVKQFRGVLSRLEEENIIQFETDINDSGFDISDVRKIR